MNEKMKASKRTVFKNIKPAEVVMGIRSKQTKDLIMIECFYYNDIKEEDGENTRENYMISSLALTRDTAKDLVSHLSDFINKK